MKPRESTLPVRVLTTEEPERDSWGLRSNEGMRERSVEELVDLWEGPDNVLRGCAPFNDGTGGAEYGRPLDVSASLEWIRESILSNIKQCRKPLPGTQKSEACWLGDVNSNGGWERGECQTPSCSPSVLPGHIDVSDRPKRCKFRAVSPKAKANLPARRASIFFNQPLEVSFQLAVSCLLQLIPV